MNVVDVPDAVTHLEDLEVGIGWRRTQLLPRPCDTQPL